MLSPVLTEGNLSSAWDQNLKSYFAEVQIPNPVYNPSCPTKPIYMPKALWFKIVSIPLIKLLKFFREFYTKYKTKGEGKICSWMESQSWEISSKTIYHKFSKRLRKLMSMKKYNYKNNSWRRRSIELWTQQI